MTIRHIILLCIHFHAISPTCLCIVNATVLTLPAQGPVGHPVGHYKGYPLSTWFLGFTIVGSNPMYDTVGKTVLLSLFYLIEESIGV